MIDPALATWLRERRYRAVDADIAALHAAKDVRVAVVLPAREVADSIAAVLDCAVAPLCEAGLVDEVTVIDAASRDGTADVAAAAGARVVQQDEVLAEHGPALGKGDAMWRAVEAVDADVICFIDADTRDPHPHHVLGVLGPLLADDGVQLVKGAFARPLCRGSVELADEGGRVTELMARPLLNLNVPLLAGFRQPLAGELAARRSLLRKLAFPVGYGVEIAMLIDALDEVGLDGLAESWLGERRNDHQSLRKLGEMSYAVLAAVQRRVGARRVAAGDYLRPWTPDEPSVAVPVAERPPLAQLPERSSHAVRA